MKQKPEKNKDDLNKSSHYQKLISDLRKIIDDARAKGIEIGGRDDILTCRDCGAYEDISPTGKWEVYEKDGHLTPDERFIILDKKEKSSHRNKISYYEITYAFICTVCGLQQEEIVRDQFDE